LARRADEVFAGLPVEAKAALPQVFRQLVTIGGDDEETPTRKQAPLDTPETREGGPLEANSKKSPARQLVDAFVAARLLTAKKTDHGTPVVEVTHEALLRRWQPLVDWLRDDRELLRIHGRVGAEAARWVQAGRRTDLLLQTGKPLEEGLQLQSAGFPLDVAEREFIATSLAAARRRTHLRRLTIAALCVLTLVAVAGGLTASVMCFLAIVNRREAEGETKEVETQLQRARMAEYAVRIGVAQRDIAEGDIAGAEGLLEGCALDLRGWEHRYLLADICKWRMALTVRGDAGVLYAVRSVAFSPDGQRVVSGSDDGTLEVFDVATGRETLTLKRYADASGSVAFSRDGRRIVSGSRDGTLRVFDASTGQEALTLGERAEGLWSVAFSPDGRRIVSGSRDGRLRVWDASTGHRDLMLTPLDVTGWVDCVAVSSDGRRIVSGSDKKKLYGSVNRKMWASELVVWDASTGQETLPLRGHAGGVTSVAFSPDGRRIVSGSDDKTLKVWDVSTGQETFTLKGHAEAVTSVAFSPDGRRIVSGSDDKTLKVWDASMRQEIPGRKGR